MSTDTKRVNKIGSAARYEKLLRLDQKDSLFEREWDELVIRFDRSSRTFVVKTAGRIVRKPENTVTGRLKR